MLQLYLCSLCLCLELTNSMSVGLLYSPLPLGLSDLVTQHIFRNMSVSHFFCLVSSDIIKPTHHFQCGSVA